MTDKYWNVLFFLVLTETLVTLNLYQIVTLVPLVGLPLIDDNTKVFPVRVAVAVWSPVAEVI